MSYLTFKIISVAVLGVIALVVLATRNSKEKPQAQDNANSDGADPQPAEQPEDGQENKIDYKAIHNEIEELKHEILQMGL